MAKFKILPKWPNTGTTLLVEQIDLEETNEILRDPEVMDQIRAAEEDIKLGRTIRGEDLRGE